LVPLQGYRLIVGGFTLARWTGIGPLDAVLFARSQVAVVFSGAEGNQAGNTLTIKPLTTFIVETHTSQRRMRARVERHLEDLARRIYKDPIFVRKTIDNVEFTEWTSADGTHQIVFAFLDSAVIVGNDETSVLHSIRARIGADLPSGTSRSSRMCAFGHNRPTLQSSVLYLKVGSNRCCKLMLFIEVIRPRCDNRSAYFCGHVRRTG
jgi:hypothetical protein